MTRQTATRPTVDQALDDVVRAGQRYTRARDKLEEAAAARNAAIVTASAAGISRRTVAKAAGVTVGRVQQIVDAGG